MQEGRCLRLFVCEAAQKYTFFKRKGTLRLAQRYAGFYGSIFLQVIGYK